MKKITSIILAATALVLLVLRVHAESGAHQSSGVDNKFIFSVINFILLFVGLSLLLKKPVREFFANRHHLIRLHIEQSKKMREEAQRQYEAIQARLDHAEAEGQQFVNTVREQSEIERRHILETADKMAAKIKQDTQRIAQQELVKAKKILQAESVRLAADLARQKIEQQITKADQDRLGHDFVSSIQKAGIR